DHPGRLPSRRRDSLLNTRGPPPTVLGERGCSPAAIDMERLAISGRSWCMGFSITVDWVCSKPEAPGSRTEDRGMIEPPPPAAAVKEPPPAPSRSPAAGPDPRGRVRRRGLLVLGALLVGYAIELGFQYLPAAAPEPPVVSAAGMSFPPPPDLVGVP